MRIFVHPSMGDDLHVLTRAGASRFMNLEAPTDAARWELEYITDHGGKPWSDRSANEAECLDLWTKLNQMQQAALELPDSIRDRVQAHYVDAIDAFKRMRDLLNLPRFNVT
jgi:hypothetical protein